MARWDWLGLGERRWTKRDGEEVAPAKTAWDWLQLLVVPAMLVAIAVGFNASQSSRDQKREDTRIEEDRLRAEDVRHEQNLQRYFDRISDLLLDHGLQHAKAGSAVRDVARNVTLATLRTLDGRRKAQVVAFLSDAKLLRAGVSGQADLAVVSLESADLRGADFRDLDYMSNTVLGPADLRGARFDGVTLYGMGFEGADLRDASFREARIATSSLDVADLRRARFDRAQVSFLPRELVTFDATCLSGASFKDATFGRTSFEGAEGRGIDLRGARLGILWLDDAILMDVRGRSRDWGIRREDPEASGPLCSEFRAEP
jgi:uncharacterized protein YjbI with pentapeptide repeats